MAVDQSINPEGVSANQQPKTMSVQPASRTYWQRQCALAVGDEFLGGRGLGLPTDIASWLIVHNYADIDSWLGFNLEIPYGLSNEEDGFGICHSGESLVNIDCWLPF